MPQTAETFAKDDGYAPETWAFDAQVTAVFDNMLERSIPQYPVMRQACLDLACGFIQPDTDVVDLGCSRGEALAPLIDRHAEQNRFVGVEVSPPMLEAARARFAEDIAGGSVAIEPLDLRTDYPEVNASVTLCVLTLQFTPIEYRVDLPLLHEKAKRDAFVLHSLPRMDELTQDVDETRFGRYWVEAFNGVVMRMALLTLVLGKAE